MSIVIQGSVRARSTLAAREYVASVRSRLQSEEHRHGERAKGMRSYQDLERRITPDEIRRVWPYADVDEALSE